MKNIKIIILFAVLFWVHASLRSQTLTVPAGGGEFEHFLDLSVESEAIELDTTQYLTFHCLERQYSSPGQYRYYLSRYYSHETHMIAFGMDFEPNYSGQMRSGTITFYLEEDLQENYVSTRRPFQRTVTYTQPSLPPRQPDRITHTVYTRADGEGPHTATTYYDGLGRPVQSVRSDASPSAALLRGDHVNFIKYDCMGRPDSVSHLPYVATNAAADFVADPVSAQSAYYMQKFAGHDDNRYPYAIKHYDKSYLGMVEKEGGVGIYNSITAYPTFHTHGLNTPDYPVKRFEIAPDGTSLLFAGNYDPSQLTVGETRNVEFWGDEEQAHGVSRRNLEYRDAGGRLVARESRPASGDRRFTYYVYDDMGRQRYVVPPAQDSLLTVPGTYDLASLGRYCYYTEYDKWGRAVRQWVPGAEPVFRVYDARGRLAMIQTGNQRHTGLWTFTKYDFYDRPIMTGIHAGGSYEDHYRALNENLGHDGWQLAILGENRGGDLHGYTDQSYPSVTDPGQVLSVTYYDDYSWQTGDEYGFRTSEGLGSAPSSDVSGLLTGTLTRVLGAGEAQWLVSAVYYDADYRTIQTVGGLYPSGLEVVSNAHDFAGRVTRSRVSQSVEGVTHGYDKWFGYDAQGYATWVDQQLFGDEVNGRVRVAEWGYDELGRVMSKKIHNSLETTAYGYDIQGRCVSASSPSFAYRLGFDESLIPGTHLRTDGSVGQATWRHDDGTQKGYEYLYDRTGQLSAGRWYDSSPTSWIAADGNSERGLTYDRNGNLRGVVRTGPSGAVVDEISLSYDDPANGNAVSGIVCDGVPGEVYLYDLDGNMVRDGRTGVWIEYNELNLPKKIRHDDVSEEISYIYSAAGEKLAVEVGLPGGARSLTYYRGVMVYAAEGGASGYVNPEELRYMLQPEGLVTISDAGWTYKYFKTDHLGSTRAVLAATNSSGFGVANQLVCEQRTDFYPFGMAHASTDFADNLDVNRYLFSGKELQATAFGSSILSLYDFGSRHYDPALGRWFNTDPALQFSSPYTYCGNNPHMYVDPNGEFAFLPFLIAAAKAAAWGAGISAASYTLAVGVSDGGFNNWNWEQFGKSVGLGALSGAASFGVGTAFGAPGSLLNEAGRALTHGIVQGGTSVLGGGDFMSGFMSGAVSSGIGSGYEALGLTGSLGKGGMLGMGAFSGGVSSMISGGNFLDGAASGLAVTALNHLMHEMEGPKTKMVEGKKAGYSQMWADSFGPDGSTVEVVGYELYGSDNMILQYDEGNTSGKSISTTNPATTVNGQRVRVVEHNGKYYRITSHVHTHPNNSAYGIGISPADTITYNNLSPYGVRMKIIYNRQLYMFNGHNKYNYVPLKIAF